MTALLAQRIGDVDVRAQVVDPVDLDDHAEAAPEDVEVHATAPDRAERRTFRLKEAACLALGGEVRVHSHRLRAVHQLQARGLHALLGEDDA
ncbi:MAG: hypothetical protein WKF83_11745 [Nocardioidaceae bacterium]